MTRLLSALLLTCSFSVFANVIDEQGMPPLDLDSLHQEIRNEMQEASTSVIADAMVNLKQPDLGLMVTELNSAAMAGADGQSDSNKAQGG